MSLATKNGHDCSWPYVVLNWSGWRDLNPDSVFANPADGARLLVQAIDVAAVRHAQLVLLSSPQAYRIDPGLGDGLEPDASLATDVLESLPMSLFWSQIGVPRERRRP